MNKKLFCLPFIVIILLALSDTVLSIALALKNTTLHKANKIAQTTNNIISFCLTFVNKFDNFVPQTFSKVKQELWYKINPRLVLHFEGILKEREKLVNEAKMAIQSIPDEKKIKIKTLSENLWKIRIPAIRCVYLMGEPISDSEKLIYEFVIQRGAKTEQNPFGLYVVSYREIKK
jgi:hypothetical protein